MVARPVERCPRTTFAVDQMAAAPPLFRAESKALDASDDEPVSGLPMAAMSSAVADSRAARKAASLTVVGPGVGAAEADSVATAVGDDMGDANADGDGKADGEGGIDEGVPPVHPATAAATERTRS